MNERRLHPFTVLRFLRKTLVVYLLPLVQVLFERNWTALHTALRQDALLFLLLCAVSWGILRVSSWSLDDTGVFHLHWRLGIRLDRALRGEMLAALTIDRPLLYRMAGASRLTLYPVGAAQKHPGLYGVQRSGGYLFGAAQEPQGSLCSRRGHPAALYAGERLPQR